VTSGSHGSEDEDEMTVFWVVARCGLVEDYLSVRGAYNILRQIVLMLVELDLCSSEYGPLTDCCEQGYEPPYSAKDG
jgi:hypothetical protein